MDSCKIHTKVVHSVLNGHVTGHFASISGNREKWFFGPIINFFLINTIIGPKKISKVKKLIQYRTNLASIADWKKTCHVLKSMHSAN